MNNLIDNSSTVTDKAVSNLNLPLKKILVPSGIRIIAGLDREEQLRELVLLLEKLPKE